MPDAEIERIVRRLERCEETRDEHNERLAQVQSTLAEMRARAERYITLDDVRKLLEPVLANFAGVSESVQALTRDVRQVTNVVETNGQRLGVVFELHEKMLRAQAHAEKADALKRAEILEEELKQTKAAGTENSILNRMKKNWLPFIAGILGVLTAFGGVIALLVKLFEWIQTHWKWS